MLLNRNIFEMCYVFKSLKIFIIMWYIGDFYVEIFVDKVIFLFLFLRCRVWSFWSFVY